MAPFRFKQFSVCHDDSPMKVGTDGVSLGAWAPIGPRTLDVGAGCGLIGLMAAQRGARAVTLLEIDAAGAAEARRNAEASPWADRILTVNADFLSFVPAEPFDAILSNPPFFASGLLAPDQRRAAARHQGEMTPEAFMARAASMLAPQGTVSVVIPPDRLDAWTFAATLAALTPRRICRLLTRPSAPPRRLLLTFARSGPAESEDLAINSPEYAALTSPFYL